MNQRFLEPGVRYRFAEFEYSPEHWRLSRADRPVRIGSRACLLLERLLESPGAFVPNPVLEQVAWPETFIDSSNLRVQITKLRAIMDMPGEPSRIANIPGRGYALVVPVAKMRVGLAQWEGMARGAGPDFRGPGVPQWSMHGFFVPKC